MTDTARLLQQHSFVELGARQRAKALLDEGSFRELIGPFDRVMSPWLIQQGIVAQADDGVIVAKGTVGGLPVVIAAIEGAFQGGSMGEVGGAKMAGALELAAEDNRNGIPTAAILLWRPAACVCRKPTLAWPRLPRFTRRLSTCASTNRWLAWWPAVWAVLAACPSPQVCAAICWSLRKHDWA